MPTLGVKVNFSNYKNSLKVLTAEVDSSSPKLIARTSTATAAPVRAAGAPQSAGQGL